MPAALAFHPAIGVVAATVFQLVPFVLLSLMARTRPDVAILACALVEPVFRLAPGGGLDPRNALMAAILIAFGLFQMRTRARDGFTAGFAQRMGYSAVWHILWGLARPPAPFSSRAALDRNEPILTRRRRSHTSSAPQAGMM